MVQQIDGAHCSGAGPTIVVPYHPWRPRWSAHGRGFVDFTHGHPASGWAAVTWRDGLGAGMMVPGGGRCVACPIIAYTINGSPLRDMCAMLGSLTHWGLNTMTILCAIFLNKLPDSKFQKELMNENCYSSASYFESCSNWKEYHWFG